MVVGIGMDCVQVDRMKKSLARPRFWERVFSPEERALLDSLAAHRRVQSAAACFAAKEAFLKAAGTGLGGFSLEEVAALRREGGAPYYAFGGKAAAFMEEKGLTAHLSLSHENGLAFAFAVLEER